MRGVDRKRQRVVAPLRVLNGMVVLEVADMLAGPSPPLLAALPLPQRKHTGAHAGVEEGVVLTHVDDVDADGLLLWRVVDPEVKPLCVAFRVYVVLQDQVVLQCTHLF